MASSEISYARARDQILDVTSNHMVPRKIKD